LLKICFTKPTSFIVEQNLSQTYRHSQWTIFQAINAPHKKHYYEAAQAAHEEFFVSTNKQIDETYKFFEKAYVAFNKY
jgi:hypothetical protein